MPFFWQQLSLSDIQLIGSVDLSIRPFLLHFKELNQSFNGGKIACLNLVSSKGKENTLKQRYEAIMTQTNLKQAQYFYFDFHQECEENSDPMMHMLQTKVFPQQIEPGGIFCEHQYILRQESGATKVATFIESRQSGILRTNCIDCLDRTNIAQSMASKLVLSKLILGANNLQAFEKSFTEPLIFLWAMAGDYISKQYSGTASVLTKKLLQGYQTIFDKVE